MGRRKYRKKNFYIFDYGRRARIKNMPHCFYCRSELNNSNRTLDHKQPLSLGGTNKISNVVACCKKCNSRKGDMGFEDWCNLIGYDNTEASF